jgi:hypothetical protein
MKACKGKQFDTVAEVLQHPKLRGSFHQHRHHRSVIKRSRVMQRCTVSVASARIERRAIPEQQHCEINKPVGSCNMERRGVLVPRVHGIRHP